MTINPRSVAFHEAGHAVMALYCGWPVARLTIVPDPEKGHDGSMSFPNELPAPLHGYDPIEVAAMVALAGPIAQKLAMGGDFDHDGARHDQDLATVQTYRLYGEVGAEAGFESMQRSVLRLLMLTPGLWAAVGRLAELLLERGELDGDAILEAYKRQPTGEERNVICW